MNALDYACELISFDSTCHRSNAEVSGWVQRTLEGLGFETECIGYDDAAGERKLNILGRKGSGRGGLAYFGHTDVVPADDWSAEGPGPFEPVVRDGRLYGRGSTDMKASIACMLAAVAELGDRSLRSPIYVSCTADEEVNHGGAEAIVRGSQLYRQLVEGGARGIVGEPTEMQVVYAHKGGCRFTVTSRGRAAHSSSREGHNANLAMIPMLAELKAIHDETEFDPKWQNAEFDPPTVCWNIGINDYTYATNITPPQSVATVGFRPMPGTDTEYLLARVRQCAAKLGLEFRIDALHPPFRTDPESEYVRQAVQVCGGRPPHTVAYGSEASNLRGLRDLIVLGPGNITQAHTCDEWIAVAQLTAGQRIYREMIERECL
jgi:acetylornithine deacetylase